MNEENDQKPEGSEQDLSEFARSRSQPPPGEGGSGGSFMRGCGIVIGVVALIFFLIVGVCFIKLSQW